MSAFNGKYILEVIQMIKSVKKLSIFLALIMCFSASLISFPSSAARGWAKDNYGWYYFNGDSYHYSTWAIIDGNWYYFTNDGYMDYSEYRDGCWLGSDGVWNQAYSGGTWKANDTGWWFEDCDWYPAGQWLWINGKCYYFADNGYLETGCYRDGCWLGSDGAWDSSYSGASWYSDGNRFWFEDNGWYPVSQIIKIDGVYYSFDSKGYWDGKSYSEEQYKNMNKNSSQDNRKDTKSGIKSSDGTNIDGTNDDSTNTDSDDNLYDGNTNDGSDIDYGSNDNDTVSDTDEYKIDITAYSYKITPLLPPFNEYFFIETDNPDPESFNFADKDSKYKEEMDAYIRPNTVYYADVIYENEETKRVKGGYIASAEYTDGGTLILQRAEKIVTDYGYYTSESFEYEDTDITVKVADVIDSTDYLIQTYGDNSKGFFEQMTSIQNGFSEICLYNGVSILGELLKGDGEWGISNSPHIDQNFYIQDPYYRDYGESMLVSGLYPYRYDSIGFPNEMLNVAERLGFDFEAKWSSSYHDEIDYTYGGETHSYGGSGHGGGQGIHKDMVRYFFSFDGSSDDAANDISLGSLSKKINYYGSLTIEEETLEGTITWADIRKTVGDGSYVKLVEVNGIYGDTEEGYTYLYDNGADSEYDDWSWGNIGYFSYSWYDGRYFDGYEVFEKGTKFGDIGSNGEDTSKARIIQKDVKIPIPDASKYWCYGLFDSLDKFAETYPAYNPKTKTWEGYVTYSYNWDTGNYELQMLLDELKIYDETNNTYSPITDSAFLDACTITPEEAKKMGLDKNADKDPEEYYIYDKVSKPGTYHKNSE